MRRSERKMKRERQRGKEEDCRKGISDDDDDEEGEV